MIPRDFITEWQDHAPWTDESQVEQDLVISRAIVELFSVPELPQRLLFRGGTALYKLYFKPAARYSEDIDLVQANASPIGDTLDRLRSVLDPWLGKPRRQFKEGRVNLVYRYHSEQEPPAKMRLKIEVNTREHFSELGATTMPFSVDSRWFDGAVDVPTFELDELMGTKVRALYQRKKGRDLFDVWHALESGKADRDRMLACFHRYMTEGGHAVTRAQFEQNLAEKRGIGDFRDDIVPLVRSGIHWDFDEAMDSVLYHLVSRLPGAPWKKSEE